MEKTDLRIIYMGTPEFAVAPLKAIIENGYQVVGVITAPDKPAGRGQKLKTTPVKDYAISKKLPVLQPEKLKNPDFLSALQELNANLQVVVAFRMLPEVVWSMPSLGTFNLHASLLPQYRGAAPINWAVINGEKKTGVTTFFIQHEIDTGNILLQKDIPIDTTDTAGSLHDKLMSLGAEVVLETIDNILHKSIQPKKQDDLIRKDTQLLPAPKIFKDDCRIQWDQPVEKVYNFIRGLSPYPAAYTEFIDDLGTQISFKIFETNIHPAIAKSNTNAGTIRSDGKSYLHIDCKEGTLEILTLQQAGKKRMNVADFLRGSSNKYQFIKAL